ncbi:MAG TPA: hydroxymethylbilane synthase [Ktedonobacteraceae bacterium]|nr:hydroxymethylbilane synthase [Ktedonobacteraceae bacterium]
MGTRASKLAIIQTQWVVDHLHQHEPELEIIIKRIQTTGDTKAGVPLTQMGGDGVFVMEIEHALMQRNIDLAVHSLKDLPTTQPEGLCICVVGTREDARDVLVVNGQSDLGSLFESGRSRYLRIGTCSLRRTAQIRALIPQAEILPLRGNVDTRLHKLDAGDYDGILLAAAGLHRLGKHEQLAHRVNYLPIELMMPAPGQGALAVEFRNGSEIQTLVASLKNNVTQITASAERMFMHRLGVGCSLPVAAYGEIVGDRLILKGLVISLDGQRKVLVQGSIPWTSETHIENAEELGLQLADRALSEGAAEIIRTSYEMQFQGSQNA